MTNTIAVSPGVKLDAPTEESFDRITAIALRLLDVPAAMITLASEPRTWCRSRAGESSRVGRAEIEESCSLCDVILERGAPFAVHDLGGEAVDLPIDLPAGVRAYAGHPLRGRDGAVLGTLCVFSSRPRGWTATDLGSLESLARIAVAEIELRRALDHAAEQALALEHAQEIIREQAALQEAEAGRQRIADILERITDAFFELDDEWRFVKVNRQLELLLGWSREDLLGRYAWDVLGLGADGDLRQAIERAHRENVAVGLETTLPRLGAWFQVHAYPADDGGIAAFLRDVSERRAAVDKLTREALHDALTGLPNRIQFMQRLARYVERNERRGEYGYAVLFLDLDRFKVINDSLGHVIGDELLVQIARRLESCLRPVDMVARFGGDEFALLLHDVQDVADAVQVARRIEEALEHALDPAGYQVYTSASIGITLSSMGYTSSEEVLRDADTAMYRAKSSGVPWALFDSTMHEHAVTRLHLESQLRPALDQDQFRIFYQPIVDLRNGRLAGFEALLRWFHPQRGILSPHEFVPMAEETGIIVPIGWWVLDQACRALVEWEAAVPGARLRVNVNLSGRQLVQQDMVERVDDMLATHRIRPEALSLEITESVLMKNPEQVADTLRALKQRGVHLCIDDFGTGYSSFTYLHRFPVDTLKVDRTFVARLDREAGSHEIVQAIIGLAHSLGLEAIAEGIEKPEQLRALQPLRPPYAQGFLFGRPLDAAAALRLAREGRVFF